MNVRRNLKRISVAAGISVVSLVGLHSIVSLPVGSSVSIEEDEPGWNCSTMGNRICGPVVPDYVWEACEGTVNDSVCAWIQEIG